MIMVTCICILTGMGSRPIIEVVAVTGATGYLAIWRHCTMKACLKFMVFGIMIMAACPAFAIDPGIAKGTLMTNGKQVAITHAYAQTHDNAEGLLDFPKELRIVLADRAVPQESLRGIAFLPVTQLAREGKVQGILIRLNPDDRKRMYVTLLQQPETPGTSLMTLTLSDSARELIRKFRLGGNRVSGEVERTEKGSPEPGAFPRMSYDATFSAPLFHELPVTADLRGAAAQKSPHVVLLRKKAAALGAGDFGAARTFMSLKAQRHMDAFLAQAGPESARISKEMVTDMENSIAKIDRVVVRGGSAVALAGKDTWFVFVQEGGTWKSDD